MNNKPITDKLSEFLASSFCLYLMTHNYHWNVSGSLFHTLHKMFEDQYTEIWKALDDIAERIRSLGATVPSTLDDFKKLSCIDEPTKEADAVSMVNSIIDNTGKLISCAEDVMETAEKNGDQPTVDLISERISIHQKYMWMLKSLLNKGNSIKEKMLEYAVNVYGGVENLIEAVLSDEEKLAYANSRRKDAIANLKRLSDEANNNLKKGRFEGTPEKFYRQSRPSFRRMKHYGEYIKKLQNKMNGEQ